MELTNLIHNEQMEVYKFHRMKQTCNLYGYCHEINKEQSKHVKKLQFLEGLKQELDRINNHGNKKD